MNAKQLVSNHGVFMLLLMGACAVIATLLVVFVIEPEDQKVFDKATLKINNINTCSGLIMYRSDVHNLDILSDQYDKLLDSIIKRMEILKCP